MISRCLALGGLAHLVLASSLSAGPFTPRGTQFVNHSLLPPSDCASCHASYDSQNHIEPWDTWAGSMMANASRDPIFWAALDVSADRRGDFLAEQCAGDVGLLREVESLRAEAATLSFWARMARIFCGSARKL